MIVVYLRFLEVPARRLYIESYVVFAVFLAKVAQEEMSDKLTHFEQAAVFFLGPDGGCAGQCGSINSWTVAA